MPKKRVFPQQAAGFIETLFGDAASIFVLEFPIPRHKLGGLLSLGRIRWYGEPLKTGLFLSFFPGLPIKGA
jgi:hypothetical protein